MKPSDYKILVVDDNADLCEVVQDDLEDAGFQTQAAYSGNQAFAIIEKTKIDLIVSDVQMPDGNGVELLDMIKKYNPHKPVVLFMTGQSNLSDDEAFAKGVDAILRKPVDPDELVETVKKALSSPEKRWTKRGARVETSFNIEFSAEDKALQSKVINIGRGGMFITLKRDFPKISEKILFKIPLANEKILSGEGVIRWVREVRGKDGKPAGIGVEFVSMSDESRELIADLVNSDLVPFIPDK